MLFYLKRNYFYRDINNTVNYTWPVRALMKMNEEVKSHIFPSFLDQTSISYFINVRN